MEPAVLCWPPCGATGTGNPVAGLDGVDVGAPWRLGQSWLVGVESGPGVGAW